MREITVSDYIIEFLIKNEVTDIFGYQGGMIAYMFNSLGKYKDKINYHHFGNEQGAAFAACSYAEASGKLGVALSTSGPGFTNMLTGIANAYFDSLPVMFISGQVNTKDKKKNNRFRQLGFQEMQACKLAQHVTNGIYDIDNDTDIVKTLDDAYRKAFKHRMGPVYLDLPINICRNILSIDEIRKIDIIESFKEYDASKVIDELVSSKKPVIIAGAGIKQCHYKNEFRKLVETLKIPVVCTMPGMDILPSSSDSKMGYIGGTARREAGIVLQNADFVLSLGTRLCSKQIGHNLDLFAPKANKFHRVDIDCFEFDRKVKKDENEINIDLRSFIDGANAYLAKIGYVNKNNEWLDKCKDLVSTLKDCDNTSVNKLYTKITNMIDSNSNILLDVGKNQIYGAQSLISKENTELYMSAGLGSMGYSIPASIGAYYANRKMTYSFNGDGGAQMNIQELNTIAKNKLPIKIIVFDNKALGNIVAFQQQYLDNHIVATMEKEGDYFSCDFVKIAEAYGIKGIKLTKVDDIDKYKDDLTSDEAVLFQYEYEDEPSYPGIVAGGDFINDGNALSEEIKEKIRKIMDIE